MKGRWFAIFLSVAVFVLIVPIRSTDGVECGICEIVAREIENLALFAPEEIEKLLDGVCKILKFIPEVEEKCDDFVEKYGTMIIKLIVKGLDPTKICEQIGLCNKCSLRETPNDGSRSYEQITIIIAVLMAVLRKDYVKFKVYPVIDLDLDGFSSVHSQYSSGCEWRGKDCQPLKHKIHPMLSSHYMSTANDPEELLFHKTGEDYNCNGISGVEKSSGVTYEDKFCGSYEDDRNLVTIGDSICAGFQIMEKWFDLDHIMEFVERGLISQLSFPESAMVTGYDPHYDIPNEDVTSFYTYLFHKNRCIHRQFMNLCVGGAMVGDIEFQLSKYKLDKEKVKPSVVYYGLYSNDACRSTYDDMTSLSDFKNSFLSSLRTLDQKLVKGSKVLIVGNTDGNLLYDTLHDRSHPVSSKSTNFTYAQVWDFLHCLDLEFCGMWLNTNATARKLGVERAQQYNDFMKKEVESDEKYENFEMRYLDYHEIALRAMKNMKELGLDSYLYFEKFDGFHVSMEYGHPFSGQAMGQLLDEKYPGWLGEENPFNDQIKQRFGAQGGY